MRCVVQRVTRAQVTVEGETVGQIGKGFMVLVGVESEDGPKDMSYCVEKIAGLRVFEDSEDKMNLSLSDVGGQVLLVSNSPCWATRAMAAGQFHPGRASRNRRPMVEEMAQALRQKGLHVETGRFQTHMQVELVNDGPVTLLLDSRKGF